MNSKKTRSKNRNRRNSGLSDHKRSGKILTPPMRNLPNMQSIPWLRDTFPNMLWLCSLITKYGDKPGMMLAARVLDRISETVDPEKGAEGLPFVLTGELTSFEKVPDDKRAAVIEALQDDGLYEDGFPWVLVRGLQKYEGVPGAWVLDGWKDNLQIIPADQPERFLRDVVLANSHGQSSGATKVKAVLIRAYLQAGKLMLPPGIAKEWGEILPRYPDEITEEERRRIEPSLRAASMAMLGLDKSDDNSYDLEWARSFWRQNWRLYSCDIPTVAQQQPEPESEGASRISTVRRHWTERLDELTERFLSKSRSVDPDLYSPDRHEVLTGLVYRQLRTLSIMVNYPALWTMEHGSAMIRSVLEARIVVKWLLHRNDPALFARFEDYGRGRLKLLKLHLEEYRDSLETPPEGLDEQIEYFDALVNSEIWEEFQDISIEGSFAGVDTRRMAEQVGLLTEYRLVFAPASAAVHGEWNSLDQYVLSQCENPLHRRHRIPNSDPMLRLGPDVVQTALGMLEGLVDEYDAGI